MTKPSQSERALSINVGGDKAELNQQAEPAKEDSSSDHRNLLAMLFDNWAPLAIIAVVMVWPVTRHLFGSLPSVARFVPDAVIGVVTIILIFRIVVSRGWAIIPGRYIAIFLGFVYVALAGVILNEVSGDTIFAGVRLYFRYVPLFLIPFAYNFGERDYRFQLGFVAFLLLLQVPAALWERFILYRHLFTGDYITGTMISSASLAIVGGVAVAYVVALVTDDRLKKPTAILLCVSFLLPASLAETKVTPIVLGVGLVGLLIARRKFMDTRKIVFATGVSVFLLAGFVLIYDQLYSRAGDAGYLDLMTDSERMLDNYNMRGVKALPFSIPIRDRGYMIAKETPKLSEEVPQVGRVDSMTLPFYALFPSEKVYLMLGLGIGNMDSNFGTGGEYQIIEQIYHGSKVTISHLLWETGVLGTLFFVALIGTMLIDTYKISQSTTGFLQILAAAQVGFSMIVLLCLIYTNLLHLREVLVLYLCFSGAVLVEARKLTFKASYV